MMTTMMIMLVELLLLLFIFDSTPTGLAFCPIVPQHQQLQQPQQQIGGVSSSTKLSLLPVLLLPVVPVIVQSHPQQRRRPLLSVVQQRPTTTRTFRGNTKAPYNRCAVIPTPYFAENNDDNTNDNDDKNDDTTTLSIVQMIDELAQQVKIAALQANAKAAIYTIDNRISSSNNNNNNKKKYQLIMTRYRYYIQACCYYTLFLLYRAYRGLFMILPAVFTETFRKLQLVIIDTGSTSNTPFDDDNNNNNDDDDDGTDTGTTTTTTTTSLSSVDPPMTIRTRITISIVSLFVVGTYVMSGAIRVTTSLVRSIFNGSTIVQSLQNAIQIQEQNEMTLLQKSISTTTTTSPATTTTTNNSNVS